MGRPKPEARLWLEEIESRKEETWDDADFRRRNSFFFRRWGVDVKKLRISTWSWSRVGADGRIEPKAKVRSEANAARA